MTAVARHWWCPTHGDDVPVQPDDFGVMLCAVPGCTRMAKYYTGRGDEITEQAPTRCAGPERHPLTPGNMNVSWLGCLCGGHRTWTCHTCLAVIYGPPRRDGCAVEGRRRYPDPHVGNAG